MITIFTVVEVFLVAMLVSYSVVPLCRKAAWRLGYLDHPRGNKVHARPTPLLGGVAIYAAFIIGLVTALNPGNDPKILSIIMGSAILFVIGLVDDKIGMMPELKLLAQFLAAMSVVKAGIRMEFLQNYYLNTVLTYVWLVGVTNSFNLLDNMNGLSSGIAGIAGIFFGIVMWTSGQPAVAVMSFALAGSCLGFLKHNFPKANIFMGDTGSLVIGFILASIAVLGSWNTRFLTTSLMMPVIILAYPIFDTTLVTAMRLMEGRSVFQGGRDHSSHRLALLGLKRRRTVLVIFGICVMLGLGALLVQRLALKPAILVIALIAAFMAGLGIRLAMVDTGRFGRRRRKKGIE